MDRLDLLLLSEQISDLGKLLHQIMLDLDSFAGRLYAIDSLIDQSIIKLALPNENKRKAAKDVLRDENEFYRDWDIQVSELKQQKMSVAYERENLKSILEIELTDIKRSTAKMESQYINDWINQTNYVASEKQESSFNI